LGHISTKTGSVPVGVSYGPGAVAKSPHVGVSPEDHIGPDDHPADDGAGDDGDDEGAPVIDDIDRFEDGVFLNGNATNGDGGAA